jgi:large repetitive protein
LESPALIVAFQPPSGSPSSPVPPVPVPLPPVPPLPPSNIPPEIIGAINTGSVTEDASTTASGLMLFSDLDLADAHAVSVTPAGTGYLGMLTASVTADPSGAAAGVLAWTFTVDSAALQFLAGGDELTQIYTITVDDGAGGTASEDVAITIIGTNDNPLITGAVVAGAVTEDSSEDPATASGTIDFGDVDLADIHVVSVTPASAGYLGTLTAAVSNPSTGDGSGQVEWSFAVDAAALQFLADGQQLTQTYTIAIDDGAGGTVAQDVTVTITGTNDAPVVTAADVVGGVEEDVSPTVSGTIEFGDVDLTDAHTVSAIPAAGGYLGTFTASLSDPATGDGSGEVTWTF